MWWECSECGGQVDRPSAPVICPDCGMAGVIFMPADPDDLIADDSSDDLGARWLRAGIEQSSFVSPG